jgi:hypothetical protein
MRSMRRRRRKSIALVLFLATGGGLPLLAHVRATVPQALAASGAVHIAASAEGDNEDNGQSCGVERWAVKTLQDPRARLISRRVSTTVIALRRLRPPASLSPTRIPGVETTIYTVTASLVAAKGEDDGDIHLVIADPRTNQTMIAELPSPSCDRGAPPLRRQQMTQARAALVHACGAPSDSHFTLYSRRALARIDGIGFWDYQHGQRGVAPNAIEIHPVLALRVVHC